MTAAVEGSSCSSEVWFTSRLEGEHSPRFDSCASKIAVAGFLRGIRARDHSRDFVDIRIRVSGNLMPKHIGSSMYSAISFVLRQTNVDHVGGQLAVTGRCWGRRLAMQASAVANAARV